MKTKMERLALFHLFCKITDAFVAMYIYLQMPTHLPMYIHLYSMHKYRRVFNVLGMCFFSSILN